MQSEWKRVWWRGFRRGGRPGGGQRLDGPTHVMPVSSDSSSEIVEVVIGSAHEE